MILGDICTRSCGFCNVSTGRPDLVDLDEPMRVAQAVADMQLRYVVLTSVNRDELDDGGAFIWAQTINSIAQLCPQTKIEALIPDFVGNWDALEVVFCATPDVLNHNVETVERLYKEVHAAYPEASSGQALGAPRDFSRISQLGNADGIFRCLCWTTCAQQLSCS